MNVVIGVDLAIGAIRSSDEIVDILRLICHALDNAADLSRYLDDVAEMIPTGGNARLMLEGGEILNGNSKIVIDIYDDTGNVVSRISKMDDIAEIALDEGYNVIKVHSYRDAGINYILYNNFDKILQPQMVTPIGVNICWIKDIMRDMRGKER